jgi:hypothetical protein
MYGEDSELEEQTKKKRSSYYERVSSLPSVELEEMGRVFQTLAALFTQYNKTISDENYS